MVEAGTPGLDCDIRLRQATLDDVELLMLWSSSPHYSGEFNDFGLARHRPYLELITKNELIGPNGGTLMVERIAGNEAIGRSRNSARRDRRDSARESARKAGY